MRTSLVAGEAVVGDGRVGGRSRRHRSERVVAGVGVGDMCAARPTERRDIPQMVGVSKVEHTRSRAHLRLHGHDPAAEAVMGFPRVINAIAQPSIEAQPYNYLLRR